MRPWDYIKEQLELIGFIDPQELQGGRVSRLVEARDRDNQTWRAIIGWYPLNARWYPPNQDGDWPLVVATHEEAIKAFSEWVATWREEYGRYPRTGEIAAAFHVAELTARNWVKSLRRRNLYPAYQSVEETLLTGIVEARLYLKDGRCYFCGSETDHKLHCPVSEWNARPANPGN